MPEGDTLHKLALFMRPRLVGERVAAVVVAGRPQPELMRLVVVHVAARGKHLLVYLGRPSATANATAAGWILRVHLGMYGSWHSYGRHAAWHKPRRAASVVLSTQHGMDYVCFYAQDVACLPLSAATATRDVLPHLGPNLLPWQPYGAPSAPEPKDPAGLAAQAGARSADTQTLALLAQRLASCRPDTPLVDLLLNQRMAAGFGNVYKSELLHVEKLSVFGTVGQVPPAQLVQLYARGMRWLQQNLGGWRRTTTWELGQQTGRRDLPRLYVYARAQKPCLTCQTPIVRALLGRHRRSTYWCPRCQPEPSAAASASQR